MKTLKLPKVFSHGYPIEQNHQFKDKNQAALKQFYAGWQVMNQPLAAKVLKNLLTLHLVEFEGPKLRELAQGVLPAIQLDQAQESRKQYVKLLIELIEGQRLVPEGVPNLTDAQAKLSLIQAVWPVVSQSATKHDFDLLTKSVVYMHQSTQVAPKRRHRYIEPDLDLANNLADVEKEAQKTDDGPFK